MSDPERRAVVSGEPTKHSPGCEMGCTDPNCTLAQCCECGEDWPCEVTQLRGAVDRVNELANLWEMEAVERDDLNAVEMIRLALKGDE